MPEVKFKVDRERLTKSAYNFAECALNQGGLDPVLSKVLSALIKGRNDICAVAEALSLGKFKDSRLATIAVGEHISGLIHRDDVSDSTRSLLSKLLEGVKADDPNAVLEIARGGVMTSNLPFVAKFGAAEVLDSIVVGG
jgi:hypothetical protein